MTGKSGTARREPDHPPSLELNRPPFLMAFHGTTSRGFDEHSGSSTLEAQSVIQSLTYRRVVDIRQLTPVRESVVIAADPLNRLLLELAVILPGGLFDKPQVNRSFVPGLLEDGDCKVSFGAEVGLVSFYNRRAT